MTPICQSSLPLSPWADPRTARLPGMLPLEMAEWLQVDDAYDGQMAERDRLLAERRDDVYQISGCAAAAACETLALVLKAVASRADYASDGGRIRRPDGVVVAIDGDDPLVSAARLVQEDLCLMQPGQGEHQLSGAVLCFPASWTLAEKFKRPLTGIHGVVKPYDAEVARRVQRLFDAIRPGRPLWRANAHFYDDPALFSPRSERDPRTPVRHPAPYVRSERQCLLRLPDSGAVLFSIHTYLVRQRDLTAEQARTLGAHHPNQKADG